jgi:hypothetical protein
MADAGQGNGCRFAVLCLGDRRDAWLVLEVLCIYIIKLPIKPLICNEFGTIHAGMVIVQVKGPDALIS